MTTISAKKMLDLNSKELKTIEEQLDKPNTISKLNISNNLLTNLRGIEACSDLSWLNASHNQIDSIKHLKKLIHLNVLNLGYNKVKSTTHIGKLKELKALIVNNNELSSMDGLKSLKDLNTLVCSHNKLVEIDVTNLSNLLKLSAAHNQFKEVPNLTFQKDLKEVRLNDNLISVIPEWISSCKRLKILDLGNNKLDNFENIKLLSKLPFLENLNLKGNPIATSEEFYIQMKLAFPNLRICDGKKLQDLYFKALEDKDKNKQKKHTDEDSSDDEKIKTESKKDGSSVETVAGKNDKTITDRGFKSKTKVNTDVEANKEHHKRKKRKKRKNSTQPSIKHTEQNSDDPQSNDINSSKNIEIIENIEDAPPNVKKKKKQEKSNALTEKENIVTNNNEDIDISDTYLKKDKKRLAEEKSDDVPVKKKKKKKKNAEDKLQRSGVVSVKNVKRKHKNKQTAVDVLLATSLDKSSSVGLGVLNQESSW